MNDNTRTQSLVQPIGTDVKHSIDYKHIDEFIDDPYVLFSNPELAYPHFMFSHFRLDASTKMAYRPFMKQFKLFVDYEGETWRVIGASSLGDIWLTRDFSRENGYDRRVDPDFTKFSNWRDKGDWPLSWSDRVALANHYYNAAIPDGAPKCNKYTSRMSDLAVPFHFMGCPEKERQFLLQRKCSSSATTQQNKPSQS